MQPQTFIQIHYHTRPGGVTRVMGDYARAFRRLAGAERNVVVCGDDGSGVADSGAAVVTVRGLGYRDFEARPDWASATASLLKALDRVLDDPACRRPVCVVGHNITLGKNLALTSAFAACAAGRAASGDDVRFYSVVHDLAEEGRVDRLEQIDRLQRAGVAVQRHRYPALANVTFVAVNRQTAAALRAAHLPVVAMPNVVQIDARAVAAGRRDRAHVGRRLADLAKRDGTGWRADAGFVLYPSRIVKRKNMLEAILLVCVAGHMNLVTGGPGTSPEARFWHRLLLDFCRRHSFPVVLDAERALTALPAVTGDRHAPMSVLMGAAAACVSTSVREGFGFGVYEPWLSGRLVMGRAFAGTWVNHPFLYDGLLVPVGWTDLPAIRARLQTVARLLRVRPPAYSIVQKHHGRDMVDFCLLEAGQQCGIIEGLLLNRLSLADVAVRVGVRTMPVSRYLAATVDRESAQRIRRQISSCLGPAAFVQAFARCYLRRRINRHRRGEPRQLALRCFSVKSLAIS